MQTWVCWRNFKLLSYFLSLFLGLCGCFHSSSLPPPQIHGGRHISGPVAVGRIPVVTGFSACLIELPGARNVWKFKTDVHIISPSFTYLLKAISLGPDLLQDMLLISLWDPCRMSYMCSGALRKKYPSWKRSKSESKHQISQWWVHL